MTNTPRPRHPEVPEESEVPSAAPAGLISHVRNGMWNILKGAKEWALSPQAVPSELRGLLTKEQVKAALEEYEREHDKSYNQRMAVETSMGNLSFEKNIAMNTVGDDARKMANLQAILQMNYMPDVELTEAQQIAFNVYCSKLLNLPYSNLL